MTAETTTHDGLLSPQEIIIEIADLTAPTWVSWTQHTAIEVHWRRVEALMRSLMHATFAGAPVVESLDFHARVAATHAERHAKLATEAVSDPAD